MTARDKSDFGSGKILPEELDAATPAPGPEGDTVHPERDWATGPDLAAVEHPASASASADDGDDERGSGEHAPVESGAHFGGAPDDDAEPVELDHPPRHGAGDDAEH
ncbi:hypothetical protein ATJ88_3016 [Isoptericola jiangsuensis]|uniref:Uncharacterized protein n=1 Tax=Isoptericola jiangsuensis TaxID=548579 RepID=A0A2A9EZ06_9MICO|nr:hypothetical protein [Isoptericola jiangsuensis]PFG44294.1 hypothetical protein ATJ88_3016 [Isoptericola jiangsuensis]